jgi:predicted RNase H-like nuclease
MGRSVLAVIVSEPIARCRGHNGVMRVVGADVWKGRWVAVTADEAGVRGVAIHDDFGALLASATEAIVIGVDMPLFLPERPPRPAEVAARALLGPRRSALFITPSRRVLEAPDYTTARRLSVEQDGRGVSAQSYALRHNILEVSPLAARDERLHEVHPELSFLAMAGAPLPYAKTTWNGQVARQRLLEDEGLALPDDLGDAGLAPPIDILDAAAAAWTARRIAAGDAIALPIDGGREAIWR